MNYLFRILILLLVVQFKTLELNASKIDSLKNELNKNYPDTILVRMLYQLAFNYRSVNIDSGIIYSKKAIDLAERINYKDGILGSQNSLASNYLSMGSYDSALVTYKNILRRTPKSNKAAYAAVLSNIALAYYRKSDYTDALDYYHKSINIYKEIQQWSIIYNVSYNMGLIYIEQDDLEKAKNHYFSLLEAAEVKSDSSSFGKIYKALTSIYLDESNLDRAKIFLNKSLFIDSLFGNKSGLAISYGNLANYYFKSGNMNLAESTYMKAIDLEKEIDNKEGLARNYGNLGELYFEQAKSLKNNNDFLTKAEIYLKSSIKLYNEIGEKSARSEFLDILSKIYYSKGDFKKAYETKEKFSNLKDSIKLVESLYSMRNLEFKRDQKLKEKEIELLTTENSYRKNVSLFLIVLFILVIFLVIIALNLYNTKLKQNSDLEESIRDRTSDLEKAKSELYKALSNERELSEMKTNFILTVSHEFRTPLTAISSSAMIVELIAKDDPDILKQAKKISKSVTDLNEILESILSYSRSDADSIQPKFSEINFKDITEELIDWAKSFDDKSHIFKIIDKSNESLIKSDKNLLFKSLKEIVKNAILFSSNSSNIEIAFTDTDNEHIISIKDNGIGIDKEDIENVFEPFFKAKRNIGIKSGAGLGLSIAKNYIETIGGSIEIESDIKNGTIVKIVVPKL